MVDFNGDVCFVFSLGWTIWMIERHGVENKTDVERLKALFPWALASVLFPNVFQAFFVSVRVHPFLIPLDS